MPNSPELVRAAQTQLVRIGCFSGKIDGLLGTARIGLERYLATKGSSSGPPPITEALVSELANQTARATEEIANQIKAIQDATLSSAQLIRGITEISA